MPYRRMPFGPPPASKSKQSGLFEEVGAPAAADGITAFIDGGARGNPGPAGYGVQVKNAAGETIAEFSEFLGRRTNNFAEYSALLAALRWALEHGHKAVNVVSDSELLVKQMNGQYKVKSPDLRPLYEEARSLSRRLERFSIRHVLRAQNKQADRLANEAMDRGK